MESGGFPEVVVKGYGRGYLRTLWMDIIEKDIIFRRKIKYEETLREISTYLAGNYSKYTSFNSIKRNFGLGSDHTAKNYLRYLEESFLLSFLPKFSFKLKHRYKSEKKVYLIDTGFSKAIGFEYRKSRVLENLVAIELLRKGFKPGKTLFYWKSPQGYEVDFVLLHANKVKQLIQVAYSMEDEDTRKRELRALVKASRELACSNLLVLTWDEEWEEEVQGKKIKIEPVWKVAAQSLMSFSTSLMYSLTHFKSHS